MHDIFPFVLLAGCVLTETADNMASGMPLVAIVP